MPPEFRAVDDPDDVDWSRVTQVSVVCFVDDDDATGGVVLVLHAREGRWAIPTGRRTPDEDVWDDAVLRIPLETMGFRRQETHPFALDSDGRHAVFWVNGGKYAGTRLHAPDVPWWTGSIADGAALLRAQGDDAPAALAEAAGAARAAMTYERRVADEHRTLVGAYLSAATPEGGSGFGGSDEEWREARGVLLDALDPARSRVRFLDHGCANGHLAVSMALWARERDVELDPYGADIAAELVAEAKAEHPGLASHFFVGDALSWVHPAGDRFDLVHVLLDFVPSSAHPELIRHQLDHVVAPGGRLVLSEYGDPPSSRSAEAQVTRAGFVVAGRTRQPIRGGRERGFPSVWVDALG
ncbi:MAG TPA: class I SAM-dependent methyltransferase [Nocardioides sp.]|uniref:class I SAM-dependent methyltransferase n=1 Tax=Nocardioides sp. TaxID=35761 RepID=UPI002E316DDE|nr:class I SAM-dependent methyltransferase [Nocardioides sp.]HEX3932633.1 class I SAM-dependent methyltransferase [Nocardioides sp.]